MPSATEAQLQHSQEILELRAPDRERGAPNLHKLFRSEVCQQASYGLPGRPDHLFHLFLGERELYPRFRLAQVMLGAQLQEQPRQFFRSPSAKP